MLTPPSTAYSIFYLFLISILLPRSLRASTMIYFFGCCFFFCVFFCFCPPPRPGNVRYLSFSCGAVCARSKVVTARIRVQLVPWLWTARISAFTSCEFHCSPPPAASSLSFCRCLAFRTRRRHQKCTRQQKARAAGRRTERSLMGYSGMKHVPTTHQRYRAGSWENAFYWPPSSAAPQ